MEQSAQENKHTIMDEMKKNVTPSPSTPPMTEELLGDEKIQPTQKPVPPQSPTSTSTKAPVKKVPIKGKRLGMGFYLGCFGLFAFLFVMFVVLSVVALRGNPNQSFIPGVPVSQIKNIVSSLVNISFGLLSLIILIAVVISIFRRIITKKEEKEKRRKTMLSILITFLILMIDIGLWVFVALSLQVVPVITSSQLQAKIVVYDTSQTPPLSLADTTNLIAPLTLRFSTEQIAEAILKADPKAQIQRYQWDFHGGSKDDKFEEDKIGPDPTWMFEDKGKNSGLFYVRLKVTTLDSKGKQQEDIIGRAVTIAYVRPRIDLTVVPESGEGPLEVTFNASKTIDPDGQDPTSGLKFAWDMNGDGKFDDGNKSSMTYTFDQVGTFPVSLRVEDEDGQWSVVSKEIVVTSMKKNELIAKISATPRSGPSPLSVYFTAEESIVPPDSRITKYEWDFGDNSLKEKSISARHTFRTPGKYTVTLHVKDDKDREGTASVGIEVQGKLNPPLIKMKTTPSYIEVGKQKSIEGYIPLTVQFDASQSTDLDNDIIGFEWDFDGDGKPDEQGATPDPYTYYEEGQKTVTLTVADSAGNKVSDSILVNPKRKSLQAIISATPLSGIAPLKVQFDGSGSRYDNGTIESYWWDFNDGTTPRIYGAKIQYTFSRPGVYHVKMTILTNDGKKDSVVQDIVIQEVPLIAHFTPSTTSGRAPLSVTFDPSDSTGSIVSYSWDFGDGVGSNERQPMHTFATPGTYTVVLRVQNKDNVTDEYFTNIKVE